MWVYRLEDRLSVVKNRQWISQVICSDLLGSNLTKCTYSSKGRGRFQIAELPWNITPHQSRHLNSHSRISSTQVNRAGFLQPFGQSYRSGILLANTRSANGARFCLMLDGIGVDPLSRTVTQSEINIVRRACIKGPLSAGDAHSIRNYILQFIWMAGPRSRAAYRDVTYAPRGHLNPSLSRTHYLFLVFFLLLFLYVYVWFLFVLCVMFGLRSRDRRAFYLRHPRAFINQRIHTSHFVSFTGPRADLFTSYVA